MISLLGSMLLVTRLIGVAIVFSALLGAVIYHLGWRNQNESGFWPMRAVLGFGGVIVGGLGLFLGSLMMVGAGIIAYVVGLFVGESRPASV